MDLLLAQARQSDPPEKKLVILPRNSEDKLSPDCLPPGKRPAPSVSVASSRRQRMKKPTTAPLSRPVPIEPPNTPPSHFCFSLPRLTDLKAGRLNAYRALDNYVWTLAQDGPPVKHTGGLDQEDLHFEIVTRIWQRRDSFADSHEIEELVRRYLPLSPENQADTRQITSPRLVAVEEVDFPDAAAGWEYPCNHNERADIIRRLPTLPRDLRKLCMLLDSGYKFHEIMEYFHITLKQLYRMAYDARKHLLEIKDIRITQRGRLFVLRPFEGAVSIPMSAPHGIPAPY